MYFKLGSKGLLGSLKLFACAAFVAALATTAPAAIVFTENFTYGDGELGTASGGTWGNHSPPTGGMNIVSNALSINDDVTGDYSRSLGNPPAITSGTLYAGFDLNVSTADKPTGISAISHYFAHFAENLTPMATDQHHTSEILMLRGSSTSFYKLGIVRASGTGAAATFWNGGANLDPGTTYRVVFAYDFTSQASTLWVNPTSISSTNATNSSGTNIPAVGLNWFAFRVDDGSDGDKTIDNLIVATTFNEAANLAHPGDFDGDGDVDGADFVAWQTNFPLATGATLAQGDADSDGDVDGADFVVWQTNFPFTPGPGTSPVPEPAAWMLAGLALPALGWLRRKQAA